MKSRDMFPVIIAIARNPCRPSVGRVTGGDGGEGFVKHYKGEGMIVRSRTKYSIPPASHKFVNLGSILDSTITWSSARHNARKYHHIPRF